MKKLSIVVGVIIFLVSAISCGKKTKATEDLAIKPQLKSIAVGDALLLQSVQFTNLEKEEIQVKVNGKPANIIGKEQSLLSIQVPDVKQGKASITVQKGKEELGETVVEVVEGPSQTLLLQYTKGKVELKSKRNSSTQFEQFIGTEGRVVIYEVVSASGEVLVTGSVRHPREKEVFGGEKGEMHREQSKSQKIDFEITIPNIKEKVNIKFYEGDGAILYNKKLYQEKKLISEITIN